MKFKTFWRLLNILVLLLVSTNVVFACKCDLNISQEQHFKGADYVALIRVMSTEIRPVKELRADQQEMLEEWGIGPEYIRVSFEPKEVFKGANIAPDYLLENTIQGGGNCALALKLGHLYVVFWFKDLKGLIMDCSGTFEFDNLQNSNGGVNKMKLLRDFAENGH